MAGSDSHEAGIHFENGYESKALAAVFEFVMQNQQLFIPSRNQGRPGLLQVVRPTTGEKEAAIGSIIAAFDRVNSPVEWAA
jgi:hypothetical protein